MVDPEPGDMDPPTSILCNDRTYPKEQRRDYIVSPASIDGMIGRMNGGGLLGES